MKMGQLYKEMGFVNTGHTVQATRADLVGQYIGHTGPKTKEMITRSFGGILFIDEAYGLYKEDSRDYGSEVIEMLVKFIDMTENKDFVLVLAGYRNLMTRMLNANLNLMSRMGNWIDFPDYDGEELNQISGLLARDYGYSYPPEARWGCIENIFFCHDKRGQRRTWYLDSFTPLLTLTYPTVLSHHRAKFVEFMDLRKEFPYFSNARTVRNCMERARRVAATRILTDALDNGTKYTMQEIQTFNANDFQIMIDEIMPLARTTMLP